MPEVEDAPSWDEDAPWDEYEEMEEEDLENDGVVVLDSPPHEPMPKDRQVVDDPASDLAKASDAAKPPQHLARAVASPQQALQALPPPPLLRGSASYNSLSSLGSLCEKTAAMHISSPATEQKDGLCVVHSSSLYGFWNLNYFTHK